MKKTVAIGLLLTFPSFTQTMEIEKVDTYNSTAMEIIEKNNFQASILKKARSSDGSMIVTLDSRGDISLWDGKTGDSLDFFMAKYVDKKNQVFSIGFNNEETKVLVTTLTGVEEHEIVNFKVLKKIKEINNYLPFKRKSQSSDGSKIVTFDSKGRVALWDGQTGAPLDPFMGHFSTSIEEIPSIAFNKKGTTVIVRTSKKTEVLEIINPTALKTIGEYSSLYYMKKSQSSDGSKIVTLDYEGNISLWDGETGSPLERNLTTYLNLNEILSIKFNDTGTKIVITTLEGVDSIALEHYEGSSLDRDTNELPCCIQ
ncbi:hypothetical protein H0X06_02415 [Candidatus Dependentiae bacterium]|nr:hypothetical protein [Candidatus Dependentiae bacterium]